MNKPYLNLSNARNKKQKDRMEKINKDNVCPFCPKNILKYHKGPSLKRQVVDFNPKRFSL